MYRKAAVEQEPFRPTRTMEIHSASDEYWYFTVHEGTTLLHSSPYDKDRVRVTVRGIHFLDNLNFMDYKLWEQKKGTDDGQ